MNSQPSDHDHHHQQYYYYYPHRPSSTNRVVYSCCVPQCLGTSETRRMFKFPEDPSLQSSILGFIDRPELAGAVDIREKYFLCSDHFGAQNLQYLEELDERANRHQGVSPLSYPSEEFVCDGCMRALPSYEELKGHVAFCQGPVAEGPESASEVLIGVARPSSGRAPTKQRNVVKKSFECTECCKQFANSTGLKNHMKIHYDDRPHVCHQCGKSFTLRSCLKTHVNSIHSDRRFPCPHPNCQKKFKSYHYLKIHAKTHSNTRDFMCQTCDKKFIDRQSLKLHVRSHTGERPYSCEFCDKRFIQLNHLKTHKRLHTGEKPFVCEFCQKPFRQLSNLIDHRKTHDRNRRKRRT